MSIYYEKYWQRQKDGKIFDFYYKWNKLRRYIPKTRGITILDYGCGNGEIIKEMLKINPKAKYIGIDVSSEALSKASEQFPEVNFIKIEDGMKLPLNEGAADFVFSSEVVEHVYDVENYFQEISRILKRGGQLLLTTPIHSFIKNILITLFDFDRHFNPLGPHVRFFSKRTLFSCLNKAGLKPKTLGYYGRFKPIPWSIFVLAEKKNQRGHIDGLLGFL